MSPPSYLSLFHPPSTLTTSHSSCISFSRAHYANTQDFISSAAAAAVQNLLPRFFPIALGITTGQKWNYEYQFTGAYFVSLPQPPSLNRRLFDRSPSAPAPSHHAGTQVTVYGAVIPWISGPLAAAKYTVDGANQNVFSIPNATVSQIDIVFYQSPTLAYGTHTLTVNVTDASSTVPYLLDYLRDGEYDLDLEQRGRDRLSARNGRRRYHRTLEAVDRRDRGRRRGGVALLAAIAITLYWWFFRRHRKFYGRSAYAYGRPGSMSTYAADDRPLSHMTTHLLPQTAGAIITFAAAAISVPQNLYSGAAASLYTGSGAALAANAFAGASSASASGSSAAAPPPTASAPSSSSSHSNSRATVVSSAARAKAAEAAAESAAAAPRARGPSLMVVNPATAPDDSGALLSRATTIVPPPYSP
ncbi:uncharacterized protein BXZ73DRAFT_101517 [Epithele typhae]|uniref:uncharacterized protein n=1 Tax=Epithele typhae TaxID=378194 RepID=UPI0020078D3B|nr:uncharacterized protein BXZ73DRAFT_101517 [Epithele typhae]KAH9931604.1 hypothetical protein BXZ73DRAFT_101517 [Epithele typhae]